MTHIFFHVNDALRFYQKSPESLSQRGSVRTYYLMTESFMKIFSRHDPLILNVPETHCQS